MAIHLDHLLTLAYVARTSNLTRAAELLGKTQPAIASQIRLLNDEVGEAVVVRQGKGVALTSAGEILLQPAQIIARAKDVAEQLCQRLRGVQIGELRVACANSVSIYLLPSVLTLFNQRYPLVELKVTHYSTQDSIKMLEAGNADLAIVHGPVSHLPSNFEQKHIVNDETVLAVRYDHPLANRKRLQAKDLNGLNIISQKPNSATQILIDDLIKRTKIEFKKQFEAGSVEAVKEAVIQGFGGGFLSRLSVQREVKSGLLAALNIKDGSLQRPILLIYPQKDQITFRVQAFLDVLDENKLSMMVNAQGLRGSVSLD